MVSLNNMKTSSISIIISTKNRPQKLFNCIDSILLSSETLDEVIIVDQSKKEISSLIKSHVLKIPKFVYLYNKNKGLGSSRNLGIKCAKHPILAFTDDDCIVNVNWLKEIRKNFNKLSNISIIFGQVQPSNKKYNKICPCTITQKKRRLIHKDNFNNNTDYFVGANMIINKSKYFNNKIFKNWLGAGTIVGGGEETDLIYRTIQSGGKILYNPNILVFHNRFISKKQNINLIKKYTLSVMVLFFYYFFKKDFYFIIPRFFITDMNLTFTKTKQIKPLSEIFNRQIKFFHLLLTFLESFMIALYYFITEDH